MTRRLARRAGVTRRQVLAALALLPVGALAAGTHDAGRFFVLNTGDLKSELADARAEGRTGLLLFFEQEGCPACRHMKQNVLSRKDVQDYYGEAS